MMQMAKPRRMNDNGRVINLGTGLTRFSILFMLLPKGAVGVQYLAVLLGERV